MPNITTLKTNQQKILLGLLFCICFIWSIPSFAQYPYPKDYFIFPIKPGQTNLLAGNMGEIRNNHFHGGLDIKTEQRTGLPVYASAEGYVSRVVISHKGYGNTVYITHPNGLTTVYAHLESFNWLITKQVKAHLYQYELNECDYTLPKNLIQVKKEDIIAWSGNSGSSGGPHLHWEIRDDKERLLNPLFFDFKEVVDQVSPVIQKMAIKTMDINARANGEFGRFEFTPIRLGNGKYTYPVPVYASGHIGLEIVAYDKLSGTGNLCGVSSIEVQVDGKETFVHSIQRLGFDENPQMNHHINFKIAKERGNVFQKCYIADGNELSTYRSDAKKGIILVSDTHTYRVNIKIWDAYANYTELNFNILSTDKTKPGLTQYKSKLVKPKLSYEIQDNTLKMTCVDPNLKSKIPEGNLYLGTRNQVLKPAYVRPFEAVYLWDLRKGLPDSFLVMNKKQGFVFAGTISPHIPYQLYHPLADIYFPKGATFDTLYLEMYYNPKEDEIRIQNFNYALAHPIIITYKPQKALLSKKGISSYNIMLSNGLRYSGGEWIEDKFRFKTKIFGDYGLRKDTIAPKISPFKKTSKDIWMKIMDYPSGIASWKATLNGAFLSMLYEPKYNMLMSNPLDPNQGLKGKFILKVYDNMGNEGILEADL